MTAIAWAIFGVGVLASDAVHTWVNKKGDYDGASTAFIFFALGFVGLILVSVASFASK